VKSIQQFKETEVNQLSAALNEAASMPSASKP